MAKKMVPVGERALVARINRALSKKGRTLRRCRSDSRWLRDLGRYYIVDVYHNRIVDTDVNLETLARKMDVMDEIETLVHEGG